MNLEDYTTIIKQRENTIKLSFWDIGNDLLAVKESGKYLAKYANMDDYMLNSFSFSPARGWKCMKLAKEIKNRTIAAKVGFEKLYLLLQVPEEHREELLELVQTRQINREQLSREVKRLKNYETKGEDQILCLERQYYKLKSQLEAQKELTKDIEESLNSWLRDAKKYKTNTKIREFINDLELDLNTLG